MWNRLNILIAIFVFSAFAALSFSSAQAAEVMVASAKNPCAVNPCSMKANPCAANPCSMRANPCAASNPCSVNPCSMKANPCSMKNPCSSSGVIPLRARHIKSTRTLKKMGKKLWKDTSLGSAGLSCNTCHPNGAGLKKSAYPKYVKMPNDIVTMDQMINYCVLNPMKGKALAWNSQKMTALASYIRDHARGGSTAMNPCSKNPCSMQNPCSMKMNPCSRR